MSFGWSVGDILATLQLLNQVRIALKDTGGASSEYQEVSSFLDVLSVTLQHVNALQAAPLDPDLAQNLGRLCKHVQAPLLSFREDIQSTFEWDLGAKSTRLKFLATGRKLQWALSTSKKTKDLCDTIRGPIAAIGIVLSQQVVQTSLQMPSEIQARIAHTIDTAIDTRIKPQTLAIDSEVKAISVAQKDSTKLIEETIRDIRKSTTTEIQKHNQGITLDLRNKFNALSISHKAYTEGIAKIKDQSRTTLETVQNHTIESRTASMTVQGMISDLSTRQSRSTDLVLRRTLQTGQETAHAIQRHSSASRDQASSLHQKLDHMNCLMVAVKANVDDLSIAQRSARLSVSNSEIEKAIANIRQSFWVLLSALHALIRELIHLFAPYLAIIYRTSIQPLLLYGDHFLFEDAIGRRKWLPCLQFQHWDMFYNLLIDTFQGEAGLSRVLNGQFMVLNGYNEVPINKKAWRAMIQPKSRVIMAIMLESAAVKKGRCADPSCPGEVEFRKKEVTRVCPNCGKHLSSLKDVADESEDFGSEAGFLFNFGIDIKIPILNDGPDQKAPHNRIPSATAKFHRPFQAVDKDIIAYKRVIWQGSEESKIQEFVEDISEQSRVQGKRPPRRPRGVRQKPSRNDRLKTGPMQTPFTNSTNQQLPSFSSGNTSNGSIPTSPQKEWSVADAMDHRSMPMQERPRDPTLRSRPNITRGGDGIRKKNARFDIPAERNLNNIDQLIAQSTDEQEIKELKQQKRLLRNRQAALDSRQKKKQYTERLENEKKHYIIVINDFEKDLAEAKLTLNEWARKEQQYQQYIESMQLEKEKIIRNHTIETGTRCSPNQTPFTNSTNQQLPLFSSGNTSNGSIPTLPQKEWSVADAMDHRSMPQRIRPHSPTLRLHPDMTRGGDSIRKKNARFDIPAERNLLRNRQAALDSRQRKKQHTERFEDEKKHYIAVINNFKEDLAEAKLALDEWARKEQQYQQYIESMQLEKEEIVRNHTIETGTRCSPNHMDADSL